MQPVYIHFLRIRAAPGARREKPPPALPGAAISADGIHRREKPKLLDRASIFSPRWHMGQDLGS